MIDGIVARLRGCYFKLRNFPRIRDCKLYCAGTIRLGEGSLISGGVIVVAKGAVLDIGRDVYIGHFCNIRVQKSVTIGERCKIAQFVSLVDHDYDFRSPEWASHFRVDPIVIGPETMIGAGAVVLRGVTVEPGSIVPANLVVRRADRNAMPGIIRRQSGQ